jgi:hypothetical protein
MTASKLGPDKALRPKIYKPPRYPALAPLQVQQPHATRSPDDDEYTAELKRNFLARPIDELPSWRGERVFGMGASALTGLWKHHGPRAARARYPDCVVVKEVYPDTGPSAGLLTEAEHMGKFKDAGGHIVNLLSDAPTEDELDENVRLERIIMEFCSEGSIEDLINRRIEG